MQSEWFEWDDEKAAINLRKHGVDFEEAKTVFRRSLRDYDFGRTALGRGGARDRSWLLAVIEGIVSSTYGAQRAYPF